MGDDAFEVLDWNPGAFDHHWNRHHHINTNDATKETIAMFLCALTRLIDRAAITDIDPELIEAMLELICLYDTDNGDVKHGRFSSDVHPFTHYIKYRYHRTETNKCAGWCEITMEQFIMKGFVVNDVLTGTVMPVIAGTAPYYTGDINIKHLLNQDLVTFWCPISAHGHGTMTITDKRSSHPCSEECLLATYTGQWDYGYAHGTGTATTTCGSTFTGLWHLGRLQPGNDPIRRGVWVSHTFQESKCTRKRTERYISESMLKYA